jgi:hypothetical protein
MKHDREEGKKEGERQIDRFGERGRATQQREKTVWVDFDCWSKSTTPENFLKVSINNNNRRIKRRSSFEVAFNIIRLICLYSICSNNTAFTTISTDTKNSERLHFVGTRKY